MTDKIQDRQRLANVITQWNQDHYDLFELSQPNEACEFHGVVRFYFQDGTNVVTKCIRVASTATAREVVDVLVEKFRPDMRMLTANKYALYEVHANGEERRLENGERVLWVQLNWGTDVREGRFLLKREGDTTLAHARAGGGVDKENQGGTFKRKLSKREKKEQKKKEKEKKIAEAGSAAEQLYTDMPETRFTRSISNPEAVMKRRRQQKVEKKLQQCRGQDGQGGTLKIYGESIKPETPYKTLLLSTADNVRYVIRETMDKYGMDFTVSDPEDYCLVQVLVPPGEREYHGGNIGEERIMEDHECPLAIAMDFPPAKGTMMFHFRKRPNDAKKTKHKKLRAVSHEELRTKPEESPMKYPYLLELNPDGSDNPKGKIYRLSMSYTEVGSDPSMAIKIHGPNIQPCHCVLGLVEKDGVVTVTPNSPESETHVNNQRISETTTLQNGMTVRFGKLHVFRFIDPNFEEKLRKGQIPPDGAIQKHRMQHQKSMEPSFEPTRPTPSPREPRQQEPMETQRRNVPPQPMGSPRREENAYPPHRQQAGDALPAILEFREDKEDHFFANIILDSATAGIQFKLAPTYTIYLAVRFSLSNGYRPDLSPQDKAVRITNLVIKIANLTHQAIHSHRDNPAALAFWMANSSEILHFFKQDHDIHPFSQDAQEMLAESVQTAFHHLNRCLQYDLQRTLPAFLDDSDDDDMNEKNRMQYNRGRPSLGDVLDTLSSAMNLLRRCRVNAALTIQLFSQLFHFINMWLFNILVKEQHQFCMRIWGLRLKRRLGSIEAWAEKQGLELAADCHLCRIIQAAHLLQARKSSPDDIADITATCFKLNSLQLRELLQRYIPEPDEPPVPQQLLEGVVKIAENMADEQIKSDGREVCLEEDADLQLPFLLPEDGYTCDTIKGIPKGIEEFIDPLAKGGLCRMIPQPGTSGDWTVYMTGDETPRIDEAVRKVPQQHQPPANHHGDRPQQQLPKEPEIATVTFNKVKGSMGLSIVEATPKSEGQKVSGIYIKSVVPGGAAALDGRLQAGDQLLEVDGKGLVGLSQDKAAELMTKTGQVVSLKVVKQGAFYHGLATLLSQPSPILPRASPKKPSSPQSNKHRPQEEGPPPYNPTPDMDRVRGMDPRQKQAMQSPHNRSSPALNKYRSGISSKEMEVIYGRKDALWRTILETDLHAIISNRKPDPESAPGAFSYQNPRSKSASNLEEDTRMNIGIVDKIAPKPQTQANTKPVRKENQKKKKNSVVDLRDLQADLSKYRSQGQGQTGHRPRSKSVGEMQRPRHSVQHNAPHQNLGYPGSTPKSVHPQQQTYLTDENMNSVPVDKAQSRSSFQNLKARHNNKMRNNGLQRSQSVGSVDREQRYNPESYTVYSQAVSPTPYCPQGPSNLTPQHSRSHSASQVQSVYPQTQQYAHPPQSPYKQIPQNVPHYQGQQRPRSMSQYQGYVSQYQGHPPQGYQGQTRHVPHPQNTRQVPVRGPHHQRSRSSDLVPTRGDFFLGESYDSARGSDSIQSYGVMSPLESYNAFKALMKNTNSDSGISDSRESKNSYYDSGEPLNSPYPVFSPVSPHMLNSTMRESWDRSSLSSSANSTMVTAGHGSLSRKSRNKIQHFNQNGRDTLPGGRSMREPPHPAHRPGHHRDPREQENKSKSMANLHMDNSFDHRDPPHHTHNMRPAASVGALQHPNAPFQEYYNQGRNDPRGNDYENHPSVDPRIPRNQQDPMRNHGYHDVNHNVPPGHLVKPQLRESVEQGSPSSRHSGSSGRDERPQSAYFAHHPQPDFGREERPKSMEVNLGKMQEMQQRYGQPQHSPHQSPHERSFDSERDPNYYNMNMRAQQQQQQQQMQSGYVNQSDIPRYTANNESRQLNFYENTSPRQNEPSPAFHQLKASEPGHSEGKRPPPTMPKPSVAPKPNGPKVTPADIPRVEVDNRHTQSHFFEPKIQQQPEQRSPKVPSSQSAYIPGRGVVPHSTGFQHDPRTNSLPRGKFTPPRDSNYHPQTHQSPELPPPPQETPPELPPPPAPEDLPEELPPLPPPPANDYSLDPQYANSADPRFGSAGGFQQQGRFNQPQQRVLPQQQRNMGYVEPQQQFMQPPHSATLPNRFQQPSNDYQNIFNEKQNRSFESSMQHPTNQNVYESYNPKQPPMKVDPQLSKHRLISEVSEIAQKSQKDGGPLASPWDREEQEKLNKAREEQMSHLREQEIHDLESRPYLSPQEQDRLKKLRLEQEFQRRVQECSNRDDEDEDSDNDITSRTQVGREYLIQAIQEDISKAHRKLEELNHKQMYEEYEREKDRMQSNEDTLNKSGELERKLEMFELEKEERQQRLQKRQERKLREQEEYQRKQRDLREKQRQDYEEQKRLMMMEEERLMKKKQEEEQKRKEMERERLRELEAQREQEEARLRAEARQRQEEQHRREIEIRERERREQEKRDQELRVREEAQRLEALRLQNQPQGYNQQYANLPAHSQYGAPAPPVRGSSYDVHGANRPNERNPEIQNGFRNMNNSNFRNVPETVPKKSVSFNTQLETRNTYSVGSESDRTPYASQSSYRSSTSDQTEPHSPYGQPPTPDHAPDNVFDSTGGTPQQNHVSYKTTEITPTVVGSQEVYRDPRNRIMAQKEAQGGSTFSKKPVSDRMSFRDKMKFFAQEAGENTPKEKPKASKTLRNIESQLHNGK